MYSISAPFSYLGKSVNLSFQLLEADNVLVPTVVLPFFNVTVIGVLNPCSSLLSPTHIFSTGISIVLSSSLVLVTVNVPVFSSKLISVV